MTDASAYTPPKVWTWKKDATGNFKNINRPIAGPTHEKDLPVGRHPLQRYSLGTPNGVKVTVMLEELLALGQKGAEYDARLIQIMRGYHFGSGFVEINPNSKIRAGGSKRFGADSGLRVRRNFAVPRGKVRCFSISHDPNTRAERLSWLFWQMGSTPYLGGGFGHFYAYAPIKIEYAIDRYAMEAKRQMDVLDRRLAQTEYLARKNYCIADMAVWPWYGALAKGAVYRAGEFLDVQSYRHVQRWTEAIAQRPAVQWGRKVNCTWGKPSDQLHKRHDASDFETKTQDKLGSTPS